ncbi:hypothetical protein I4F81_007201 [Pyropia yezoensis]|uniref:Uncharacterized protein n=1 Tax=Pyropia yezoensis TaxID=2788 RepID=A0ACC3C4B5_PYRYE|nr:hypothetical protein I4F81_007201 [Neopyropia yezoensis]
MTTMAAFLPPTSPLATHLTLRGAAACRVPRSVVSVARRRAAAPAPGAPCRGVSATTTPTAMAEPPAEEGAAAPATPAAGEATASSTTTTTAAGATKEPQKQTVFGALVFGFIMAIMALGLVATLARGFVPDGLVGPA